VNDKADIVVLDAAAVMAAANDLGRVLVDCVEGGASINFVHPYSHEEAVAFFRKVASDVARGETILLAARFGSSIVGTVQLGIVMPPNQAHRADVKKLLVHRDARRRGVGAALMMAVEHAAARHGRSLLVLDTAVGDDAERLYVRSGWVRAGVIPGYALWPDGRPCDAVICWKRL
jgi:GNAT superfamily N-acetyltransferase